MANLQEQPEEMKSVHVRLNDGRGRYLRTVVLEPRPAVWPKALEVDGKIFVWACGDEYSLITPMRVKPC